MAFPLEEVSAHSRREKNIRHGHISTLHIWWARRPLAACRAFIYASLIDDPETDAEREELLKEVADLASWDAVRNPERIVRPREEGGSGLTGTELLERARQRILDCNGGKPPRLLDPFAGGGAIPLEGLRLGCEVEASDLNPVAVLILKGTVEYPQRYGQPDSRPVPDYIREAATAGDGGQARFTDGGLVAAYRHNPLATDVRYWGNWMLERARAELSEFYPPDPDGSVPVAYLWSRTVPCPNCGAEMPLIRQYWLARKENKKVALKPVLDRANKRVDFEIVEGKYVTGDPAEATTSRGDTKCLLCNQTVKAEYVRQTARDGKMSAVLTSVVLEALGSGGKRYRADRPDDLSAYRTAARWLAELEAAYEGDLPLVPDEPMPRHLTGGVITAFGVDTFGKLFNARQLVALTTFARLVRETHAEMLRAGVEAEYAKAVATYLALAVDRLADRCSSLCRWDASPKMEAIANTFSRQALPMVWDYVESVPFSESSGGFLTGIEWLILSVEGTSFSCPRSRVAKADARDLLPGTDAVITDPPYYDAINYSDLSDFFYVWLKRSIGHLHPDLLSLPLTPKKDQIVMNVYGGNGTGEDKRDAARQHYVEGMAQSFQAIAASLAADSMVGVVFAHTNPDAWSTLIAGLLHAGLVPDASWPIDTELENKAAGLGQARLRTSVWMASWPREGKPQEAFLGDVMEEMKPVIRERLLYFWNKGIRGADFFISAIGPALSVFGRHSRVLRPDGGEVTVREFLNLVRKESTQVALEQVLRGADLGVVDPITRQYVTWVWSYSRAPLEAGETIALCLATGAEYGSIVRPGSIGVETREGSKKLVKLLTVKERIRLDEDLGLDSAARPAPLIDQLQRAASLWGINRPDELATYRGALGETRWAALRTLGQAVAECLPDGDEDRRLIHGLLGSNVMAISAPAQARIATPEQLPGFEEESDGAQ